MFITFSHKNEYMVSGDYLWLRCSLKKLQTALVKYRTHLNQVRLLKTSNIIILNTMAGYHYRTSQTTVQPQFYKTSANVMRFCLIAQKNTAENEISHEFTEGYWLFSIVGGGGSELCKMHALAVRPCVQTTIV